MLERVLIVLAATGGAYVISLVLGVVLNRLTRKVQEEETRCQVHPHIRAWLREEVETFVREKHPAESASPRQLHAHLEQLREDLLTAIDAELQTPVNDALHQRKRAWSAGKPLSKADRAKEELVAQPLPPRLQDLGVLGMDGEPDAAQIAVLQAWLDQAARRAATAENDSRPATISMQ